MINSINTQELSLSVKFQRWTREQHVRKFIVKNSKNILKARFDLRKENFLILLLILICGNVQSLSVNCNYFEHWSFGYCCELLEVSYLNEGEVFTIEGQHLGEHNDDDVLMIFASFSNISYVPKEIIPKYKNLVSLLLSQLGIEHIDGAFEGSCDKIETITFYRNKLKKINSREFKNCVNLNYLDLGDNQIADISSDAFEGLTMLETLVIDTNPIKTLFPELFTSLISLKFLFMTNLEVSELNSKLFTTLKKLERFHFGSNSPHNITQIQSGTFKSMPDLQSLQIVNDNQQPMVIEKLAFEDLEKLERLVIAGSAIERLNMNSFSGLQNLIWFSVEKNQISEIERDFFTLFPNLEEFNANMNPCGNRIYYLKSGQDEEFMRDFEECFTRWDDPSASSTTVDSSTTTITPSSTSLNTESTISPNDTTQGCSSLFPSYLTIAIVCAFHMKNSFFH